MNAHKPDSNPKHHDSQSSADEAHLDRWLFGFLILLLLAIVFTPSEWLTEWSMWWNNVDQ